MDSPKARRSFSATLAITALLAQAIFMIACAQPWRHIPNPQERTQSTHRMATAGGFKRIPIDPSPRHFGSENDGTFPVAAWLKSGNAAATKIRIYIEGDGYAWRSRRVISTNPTPLRPVGLELALADPSEDSIVYLARPCQYAIPLPSKCLSSHWTSARFGKESLEALSQRIDDLLRRLRDPNSDASPSHNQLPRYQITLIGYSGGGVIATLLAATRTDIDRLITVAAPLDVHGWTARKGTSPLVDSLSPMEFLEALRLIPQIHFAGEKDERVDAEATRSFVDALQGDEAGHPSAQSPRHLQFRVVSTANHSNWPTRWNALVEEAHFDFPAAD